jgi:hypothetical protein
MREARTKRAMPNRILLVQSTTGQHASRIAGSDIVPCLEHATKAWFPRDFIVYNAPCNKPSRANRTKCPKRQIQARSKLVRKEKHNSGFHNRSVVVGHFQTSALEATLNVEALVGLGAVKNALQSS